MPIPLHSLFHLYKNYCLNWAEISSLDVAMWEYTLGVTGGTDGTSM